MLSDETAHDKSADFSEGLGADLGTRLSPAGYFALLSRLAESGDPRVRRRALATLAHIKNPGATLLLRKGLHDADASVVLEAAGTLGSRGDRSVLPVYRRLLQTKNRERRSLVLGSLKRVHYKWVVNELRTFLDDRDPFVRVEACEALCRLGDERAFMELRKAMREDNKYLRSNVYSVVKEAGGARVVPLLTKALRDKDPANRLFAAVCLARVNSARGLSVLTNTLSHGTPSLRFTVVDALAVLTDPRTIKPLKQALKDSSEEVVVRAAEALVEKGRGGSTTSSLATLLRSKHAATRLKVVAVARNAGGPAGERLLQSALSDRSRLVRLAAVDALSSLPELKERKRLQEASHDGDLSVRVAATILLVRLGDADAREQLRSFVQPAAPEYQETARALEHGKSPELVPYLQALATQGDNDARIRAIAALGLQSCGTAAEALAGLARSADTEAVRLAAVDALATIPGDLATYLLKAQLEPGSTPDLRGAAAAYLGDRGDRSALPLLREAIKQDDTRAARALCKMGDPSGVALYRKALTSGKPADRIEAATILFGLAGRL